MNACYSSDATLSPWRVMLCVCAYSMMAMYTLLVMLGAGKLCVNYAQRYGWYLRDKMEFSQDWTPDQRAGVELFAYSLRYNNHLLLYYSESTESATEPPEYGTWAYAAWEDEQIMPFAAEIDAKLRETVLGAPLQKAEYGSLAHLAADMNCLPAARALVEHNPDVLKYHTECGNDLLSLTLSNYSPESREQVLSMAEWLLEQGLTLRHSTAMLRAMLSSGESDDVMEWLLSKGLPLEPRCEKYHRGIPFDFCVSEGQGVDILTRLVSEGKIDINDRRGRGTYLQLVVEGCADAALVERLLQLGAQPDLLPEPYSIEVDGGGVCTELSETPVAIALRRLSLREPEAEEAETADEVSADYIGILRLLFRNGAAPQPLPSHWEHLDNRRAVEDLYREFGYSLTTQTP